MSLFPNSISCFFLALTLFFTVFGAQEGYDQSEEEKSKLFKEKWCNPDNCYNILNLPPIATYREIKQAYNNLSRALHPDKNPNQTESDRALYMKITTAYEILSSSASRDKYDEYLRLKSSMDSPRENIVVVLLILYGVFSVLVYVYKKQRHEDLRKAILEHHKVIKYFDDEKGIDLTGRKRKRDKNGKRIKKNKKESPKEIIAKISDNDIQHALNKLSMVVPGWEPGPVEFIKVATDLPVKLWNYALGAGQKLRWRYLYQFMNYEYSEADRQELCREHFDISPEEWKAMGEAKRQTYLQKQGKWQKKDQ